MNIADMAIEIYVAESAILRAEKLAGMKGEEATKQQANMAKLYLYKAMDIVNNSGKEAIVSFTSGDEQKVMLMGLKRFTKLSEMINVVAVRREIADQMIAENKYCYNFL
jgi:hypothetical protein